MNLTLVQYGILRASAHNLCMTANGKQESEHQYQLSLLADQVAILTGELPEERTCRDASEKAALLEKTSKTLEECMDSANKILALFIGKFIVEGQPPTAN